MDDHRDPWTDPAALVRTLRRLPPGTDLGPTRDAAADRLLRDVVIRRAEPSLVDCASAGLREEVVAVRSMLLATSVGRPGGAAPVDPVDGHRTAPAPADQSSDEAIGDAVRRLREVTGLDEVLRAGQFPLLSAVWDDTSVADPVGRLVEEQPALVVDQALRVAVHEVRLAHQDIGETVRVVEPAATGTSGRAPMRVEVASVELGTTGFRIRSEAVLPSPSTGVVGWSGFGQVVDDLGHEYLVTGFESAPADASRGRRERVLQVCFPSVTDDASRLVLVSEGYELTDITRTGAAGTRPDVVSRRVPLRLVLDVPLPRG